MTPRCLQMTGLDLYIDRGGLKYVSDMTYMVFLSMKQEVCKHLQIGKVSQDPQRETIEQQIKKYTDVIFYWCIYYSVDRMGEHHYVNTAGRDCGPVGHHSWFLRRKWMAREV